MLKVNHVKKKKVMNEEQATCWLDFSFICISIAMVHVSFTVHKI